MVEMEQVVNIVGAGIAGLTAAITLAEKHIPSRLISLQASERAQSVLAAGGINGALNTMGEQDKPEYHYIDTMHAGQEIADPRAVKALTEAAPAILKWLDRLGVPFNKSNGVIVQRNFGGQKKKRTAYARSSTGKMIMTALIDEARKYEARGLIERYPHHEFEKLMLAEHEEQAGDERTDASKICRGLFVIDLYSGKRMFMPGAVIFAAGGINGLFPGRTTGTSANSGTAAARLFSQGVRFSNLEMIQYHPTTIGIAGKRCLISEAARGEGGRLCVRKGGKLFYFMEEKYPELGNLMPRDVVSREIWFVTHDPECEPQVYLDMRKAEPEVWKTRLPDLREEILHYKGIDLRKEMLPVEPGIHYFMGGIDVDRMHRTNISGLFAAGECCSQYHGANRLGGNSTLGAVFGGRTAAESAAAQMKEKPYEACFSCNKNQAEAGEEVAAAVSENPAEAEALGSILYDALGIVRNGTSMTEADECLERIARETELKETDRMRLVLGRAILGSAILRRESRGAHYREDYPVKLEAYQGMTCAVYEDGEVRIAFRKNGG